MKQPHAPLCVGICIQLHRNNIEIIMYYLQTCQTYKKIRILSKIKNGKRKFRVKEKWFLLFTRKKKFKKRKKCQDDSCLL